MTASDARIAWRDLFANTKPVEVEIGPGRGDVLLGYAHARPDTNFFGIEHRPGASDAIMQRAARLGLTNVLAIDGDARCIVARFVPDESVAAYHVYFPDPWPKGRHHRRRRLATADFAEAVQRTLMRGGVVHVASDLRAMVDEIRDPLTRAGLVAVPDATPPAGRATTAFERKYASAGTHYARMLRPYETASRRGNEGSGSRSAGC